MSTPASLEEIVVESVPEPHAEHAAAEILKLRFGIATDRPHTLEELGKLYNITRERVRQIESKAIVKLRQNHANRALRDYL